MGFFGWVFLGGFFWVGFLMPTLLTIEIQAPEASSPTGKLFKHIILNFSLFLGESFGLPGSGSTDPFDSRSNLDPEQTDYFSVKGWLAAADDSVIGCMPSPCYGELANGTKQKASSAATILHTLEKVHVLR